MRERCPSGMSTFPPAAYDVGGYSMRQAGACLTRRRRTGMRTLRVIASLWANADRAATKQPIGPWLGEQGRLLSKATADAKLRLDKWAASTHDCVFDIRVVSLG